MPVYFAQNLFRDAGGGIIAETCNVSGALHGTVLEAEHGKNDIPVRAAFQSGGTLPDRFSEELQRHFRYSFDAVRHPEIILFP